MNYTMLHEAANRGVDDISLFAREVSTWVNVRTA
jgi:hypothetical protein